MHFHINIIWRNFFTTEIKALLTQCITYVVVIWIWREYVSPLFTVNKWLFLHTSNLFHWIKTCLMFDNFSETLCESVMIKCWVILNTFNTLLRLHFSLWSRVKNYKHSRALCTFHPWQMVSILTVIHLTTCSPVTVMYWNELRKLLLSWLCVLKINVYHDFSRLTADISLLLTLSISVAANLQL